MTTTATFDAVAQSLSSFWKYPPRDDELKALADGVKGWGTLRPLAEAIDYATRTFDDRPTIAWLLRDARRRRDLATQTTTRKGCHLCRGEQWVTGSDGIHGLRPCPRCRPLTHDLWEAGAYAVDAPRSDGPEFANVLARHAT